MRVVIRLRRARRRKVEPEQTPNRRLATGAAGLLCALGVNGFALCVWRWAADLDVLGSFPFSQGVFSHWQVWFGAGLIFQMFAALLSHYARGPGRPSRGIRARQLDKYSQQHRHPRTAV